MHTVDTYIQQPDRLVNVPFLLAIEQTYVILVEVLLLQVKLSKVW